MRHDAAAMDRDFNDVAASAGELAVRIWDRDPTLWPDADAGSAAVDDRAGDAGTGLGALLAEWPAGTREAHPRDSWAWLDAVNRSRERADEWARLGTDLQAEGVTDVLLIGMGGVIAHPRLVAARMPQTSMRLHVLDTTHPNAVQRMRDRFDPATWAMVVSSASEQMETTTLFARFHRDLVAGLGPEEAGRRVVVIAAPDSPMAAAAATIGARALVTDDVTGPMSALSASGLLPPALIGLDVVAHLASVSAMIESTRSSDTELNQASQLGAFLGAAARSSRNQLTIVVDEVDAEFASWIEHLVASATGKGAIGLVPVVAESILEPVAYGPARALVAVGERHGLRAVAEGGTPVAIIDPVEFDGLAAEVFRWQFATMVACTVTKDNPFDRVAARRADVRVRRVIEGGGQTLPVQRADDLVDQLEDAEVLCLVGFVDPDDVTGQSMHRAATILRRRYGIPVTVEFAPSGLDSIGQLHKAGFPGGMFAVIVEPGDARVAVPGMDHDFGALFAGRAAGEVQALRACDHVVAVVGLDDLLDA